MKAFATELQILHFELRKQCYPLRKARTESSDQEKCVGNFTPGCASALDGFFYSRRREIQRPVKSLSKQHIRSKADDKKKSKLAWCLTLVCRYID